MHFSQTYNQSLYSKRNVHKAIMNGTRSLHYYPNNPRMIPEGIKPFCHRMKIKVAEQYQPRQGKRTAKSGVNQSKLTDLMDSAKGIFSLRHACLFLKHCLLCVQCPLVGLH